MTTMHDIEAGAQAYAQARDALAAAVADLQADIATARRMRLPRIRDLAGRAASARRALHDLVDTSRALFERPKSRVLHGVRVGFEKGKGRIEYDDAIKVVAAIRRHHPDRPELIDIRETPSKTALATLSAAELKRLGVRVVDSGDASIVRPVDGEVDRIVAALLIADDEVQA